LSLNMHVTVSATLSHSRWPYLVHGFALVLTSFLTIALFEHGYFIIMLALAFLLTIRRIAPDPYRHLQWQCSEIRLIPVSENNESSETNKWMWAGHGRQSFAFIKLELQGEAGKKSLVIWKDQVSEASWRALNMAFSVWQPVIIQQLKAAKALPAKTVP
jgi:hypothetical protein